MPVAADPPAVRLIATDMDGTLLRSDHTISERTRHAIRAASAAGIEVVAATGRGWRSATPLLGPVPEISTAVLSNGSLIRDIGRGEDLHLFPIGAEDLVDVAARLRDAVPDAGLYWETDTDWGFDETYAVVAAELGHDRGPDARLPGVLPVAEVVIKVLVRHPRLDANGLFDLLTPVLPTSVTVAFSGGPNLIEITGAGVHKAGALEVLCATRGIDASEVVAIGDNHNDAEMLRWAGIGVAMDNAAPEAIAAADRRTGHHMDDGVAMVIESVLDRTLSSSLGV